jgi:hypothetical protein
VESSEIEVLVGELEQRVDRLRSLYEQYFMGIEKLEPLVPRKDVDRRFYVLRREQIRNTGLRFKFNMVVQRYNTYQQYWQRILREIEAGTYKRDLRKAALRFGADALTIAGKKRFGKLLDKITAEGGSEDFADVDVEFEDDGADFGRLDDEPAARKGLVEDFGRVDDEEAASMVTSAPRVHRDPAPAPELFQDDEATAPRAAAFRERDSEPPSNSGSRPSPSAAEPPAGPRPMLLSALAGPVRRAPAAPTAAGSAPPRKNFSSQPGKPSESPARAPTASHQPAEPTPPPRPAAALSPAPPRPAAALSPAPPRPAAVLSPAPPRPAPAASRPAAAPAAPAPSQPARLQPVQSSKPPERTRPAAAPRQPQPAAPAAPEPSIPQARVRQIYETYVQARRACKETTSTVTESGLAEMLRASAEKLKGKHAGKDIDFDVVIKNGKAMLKPVIKG